MEKYNKSKKYSSASIAKLPTQQKQFRNPIRHDNPKSNVIIRFKTTEFYYDVMRISPELVTNLFEDQIWTTLVFYPPKLCTKEYPVRMYHTVFVEFIEPK